MKNSKSFIHFVFIFFLAISLSGCNDKAKKVDQRDMPDGAAAKARKNIEEGRD